MKKVMFLLSFVFISMMASAQCNDIVFKINNGKLEKYSTSGSYKGSVTSDVIEYDCNNEMVVVVKSNGKVEKYSYSGSYQGSITSDARRVRIQGDIVLVTKNNGKTEKYSFSGSYKGSI